MTPEVLLAHADRAVELARSLGADEVEVAAHFAREVSVDLQKNDIHNAATAEESIFGVRIFKDGGIGFATVNGPTDLDRACEEALALAKAALPDPLNGLSDPQPFIALSEAPDPAIGRLDVGALVELGAKLLERIASRDARVAVDSGNLAAAEMVRALSTSRGFRATESTAVAGGSFFGMAVDGDDIGSFDHDSHHVRLAAELAPELEAAADRFVIKTIGALGAKKGESFRGTVILTPEAVLDFVVGNLLSVLDGRAVRNGKSPFKDRLGTAIASPLFDLVDDPRVPHGIASHAFDREGVPTRKTTIVENGVLRAFLYDVYEGRAAGRESTGHARGGAGSMPMIGPSNLTLRAGDQSFTRLCTDPPRAVVVPRFSGSCNPISGEFSGVVKGGLLMKGGARSPIKETLIAGNLHQLLQNISGVSTEIRHLGGSARIPALRVEDVSVTAG